MHIKLISGRAGHIDHTYNTGTWGIDQIKEVPDDIGRKMKSHADVYCEVQAPGIGVETVVIDDAANTEAMDINEQIALMDKEQARDFIKRNFNQEVDMRKFKTVESIRAHATMLHNQYGVVGA